MRALTVWRPHSDCIAYGGKDIENRGWRPWDSVIGEHIGIHAGQQYEPLLVRELEGFALPSREESPVGLVAVAQVRGWIERVDGQLEYGGLLSPEEAQAAAESPWWNHEAVGWVLGSVVAIPPVACRGRQSLWTVPLEVVRRARFRYRAVSAEVLDPRPRYLRQRERVAELQRLPEQRLLERATRAGIRASLEGAITAEQLATHEVAEEMADQERRLAEHERAA